MKSLRASLDEWTDAEQKRRAESKPGLETKTALCTVLLGRFGMDVEQCDAQEKEAKASSVLSTSLTFGGAEIDCADKEAAEKTENEKVCMTKKPPRLAGPFSAIKKEGKPPPVLLELERSGDVEQVEQVQTGDQVLSIP